MPVRILHAHSTFSLGGNEARAVRLMNAFGRAAEHTIVSAMPGRLSARERIDAGIKATFPTDAPSLVGLPGPLRLHRLSQYMRGFDLVLTYDWGAFDMVVARRLFAGPPLIHHEDGFDEDEAESLNPCRNLYRRIGLPAARRLVVPSERLERIAQAEWRQPAGRVERIPNGIKLAQFSQPPIDGAIPGFQRRPGEVIIGTLAGLRGVKNLPRLVRAFAAAEQKNARLIIIGEGPESEKIVAAARACGIADRVLLPGFLADPAKSLAHFDIFALSSDSEQFPISLIEAMAAGLPVAATMVGDVGSMVSQDNRPLIVEQGDEAGLAAALASLAERHDLRRSIGQANREKANADYGEVKMICRYARLYGETIGSPGHFLSALA